MAPPTKRQKTAKHNSASAPSSRRSTRSQRPLLSFELIGRVASFASLSGKGRKNDLQNICVAVGPRDVGTVRFAALRDNLDYLRRSLGVYLVCGGEGQRQSYMKCQQNILKWFAVNTDWTKHCTEENMGRYAEVEVNEESSSFEFDPLVLFNNPVAAIEFDLADVLKFLVETMDIDVGSYQWTSFSNGERIHLVGNALLLNRLDNYLCLEYLLKLDDIDPHANTLFPVGEDRNYSLINFACMNDIISFNHFEALLRHRSFDPNKPSLVHQFMIVPLMGIVYLISRVGAQPCTVELKAKTLLLLQNGADPTFVPQGLGYSSVDMAKRHLSDQSVDSEKFAQLKMMIGIMEEHIGRH